MTETSTRDRAPSRLGIERLVGGLERLAEAEDRAALAGLRRGLGKDGAPPAEVLRVVVPLLPPGPVGAKARTAAYLVAPLFASHPASWRGEGDGRWGRNFGASLAVLARRSTSAGPERRFMALLDAEFEDLGPHLRRLVALLATAAPTIPVDWRQLVLDLLRWDRVDREVQRRWAESFWAAHREQDEREGEGEFGEAEDGDGS